MRKTRRRVTASSGSTGVRWRGLVPGLVRMIGGLTAWFLRHPRPLLACIGFAGIGWALWAYAQRAELFRIAQVEVVPPSAAAYLPPSLVGRNLWQVDLEGLERHLKTEYPWVARVRVLRQLPDSLLVEVAERVPVAQVRIRSSSWARRAGGWHGVDDEGFILSQASDRPSEELAKLVGLGVGQDPLVVGAINRGERVALALRVLARLRSAPALVARQLRELDISDPRQIRFTIDDDVEVRCGSEADLEMQLERLRVALQALVGRQIPVQYVDVRFQEPVVGPRT